MDNVLIQNNHEYRLEKVWRKKKNDYTHDSKGNLYPYPIPGTPWADKKTFIDRLTLLNQFLDLKKKYQLYDEPIDCLICKKKNVTTKLYKYDDTMWQDGIIHYMEKHNIEPSLQFKQLIYNSHLFRQIKRINKNDKSNRMILEKIKQYDKEYVMIERNQMLILDALLIHGGYTKRYVGENDNEPSRYSEHAGLLDFEGTFLSKIVVSGATNRVESGDDEIYLPFGMDDMLEYEYIFHTHPPTPKPGGRAVSGILYEFPSIGDIYHFIDHHNDGNVIGSLVVTAEGLYNIRKMNNDANNINVDEDELYKAYYRTFNKTQRDAIYKYGINFNAHKFYANIAQDTSYIEAMNNTLNKYNINIDFYPRKRDKTGKWFIDTVFLVFRKNKTTDKNDKNNKNIDDIDQLI